MFFYIFFYYLLFSEKLNFLVMISGNISGMLMEYKNKEVFKYLNVVVDYFLMNDRRIYV